MVDGDVAAVTNPDGLLTEGRGAAGLTTTGDGSTRLVVDFGVPVSGYVEIGAITIDGPGTARIDFVRVRQTNYAGTRDGHFLSSDEALNRAWYASAYGVDLSTIRDTSRWVIVDGPKRDRVAYAGDLRVAALSAYHQGSGYREVVRDTINLFACQQAPDGTFMTGQHTFAWRH
jgi:hypothetical protein